MNLQLGVVTRITTNSDCWSWTSDRTMFSLENHSCFFLFVSIVTLCFLWQNSFGKLRFHSRFGHFPGLWFFISLTLQRRPYQALSPNFASYVEHQKRSIRIYFVIAQVLAIFGHYFMFMARIEYFFRGFHMYIFRISED